MKTLEIVHQKENPLLSRKEIQLEIEAAISPKMQEAEEFVAKEFSTNAENVKVKKVKGRFGSTKFIITANIYSSKEDKDSIEQKEKEKKGVPAK